jgi:glutathione synthase
MDPISSIHPAKDSSLAMLLEAQSRGMDLFYFEQNDLRIRNGKALGRARRLRVHDHGAHWFDFLGNEDVALGSLDVILMRKDPPVDPEYVHDTQLLSMAQREGLLVVNDPQGLRDLNEKLAALLFPQCCPPTLVTRSAPELKTFVAEHGDCVLKPLDGMGGRSIFRVRAGEPNLNVILETLTQGGHHQALAQRYLPEIVDGDKRILLVDGEPAPYCLARIPQGDEFRGNLAAGGKGVGRPLSERDRWIVAQVGPELKRRGMLFVGLDVIGDWLTEVNVTSPTCIRELKKYGQVDLVAKFLDVVVERLAAR